MTKLSLTKTILAAAALVGGGFALLAPSHAARAANAPTPDGGSIYSRTCAACHGSDGQAQTEKGKRLNATKFNSKWQGKVSDAKIVKAITNGRGAMPDYKKALSADEIKEVAAYLRNFR